MSRAFSSASSRARRSIDRASLTASCSASSRTASRRSALGVVGGDAADPFEGLDLLLVGLARAPRGSCRGRARGRGACDRAARACRFAGRAARRAGGGVARGSTSSLRRARASSSASRCIRSFSSFASRISSFWRARASASIRRASDWAAFIDWEAHMPRATMPTTTPPTAAATAIAATTGVSIFTSSDRSRVRPIALRQFVVRWWARSGGADRSTVRPMSGAGHLCAGFELGPAGDGPERYGSAT